MRIPLLALAALFPLPAPDPAAAEGEPEVLQFDPFKNGFDGWARTGSDRAFTLNQQEATLTLKGMSGKEVPRLVCTKRAWDRGELRMQVKKGGRKLRLLVQPAPDGKPVVLELPSSAMKPGNWTDVALRLLPAKAALVVAGADGVETEVASAEIPAGVACRFGFEAPPGTDAVATGVRFRRVYEDEPQVCEEGFVSTFDGKALGPWQSGRADLAGVFSVEKGLILGVVRTEEIGWLALGDRRLKSYELRLRAIWGTTSLIVRAIEVAPEGKFNKLDSVEISLTDHLDAEGMSDVVVRVADGGCAMSVNGKTVFDSKVKPDFDPTFISLFLAKGRKLLLRDIRIRGLDPGAAAAPRPTPTRPEPGAGAPKPQAPGWTPKGEFTEAGGAWEVAEAPAGGAGLVSLAADTASYEMRFKVARGAQGLSFVPRANRGIERAPGIRLPEALFEKEEWTEVVVKVDLLSARVQVAGEEVGALEVEQAAGPPGIRVAGGGKARLKDLEIRGLRK